MDYSIGVTREALVDVGMTGLLELKRELVADSGIKAPDYTKRHRSRSLKRRRRIGNIIIILLIYKNLNLYQKNIDQLLKIYF